MSDKPQQPALPLPLYEVVVGNIGTCYAGVDVDAARKAYRDYVNYSVDGYGRAAGESVILFEDGEIIAEHETDKEN